MGCSRWTGCAGAGSRPLLSSGPQRDGRPRVVFLVLDGLSVSAVGPSVTPQLLDWCDASGTTPHTVPAVLPASTYPNHASFVTGVPPIAHGIVANYVHDATGRARPASSVGPSAPTIFDAAHAAGLESALVVGDQELVGVMGGLAATRHWPPEGIVPQGASTDDHGYLHDDETLPMILDVLAADAPLVVAHLNAPDTAGHVHGPDADETLAVYRATDERLGPIRAAIDDRTTVTMVVSDHSMELVEDLTPLDLSPHLAEAGLTWMPEGTAAIVYGAGADPRTLLADVDGVGGVERLDEGVHLAWSAPGRWLCFDGITGEPGMHGSPRTAFQLAAVVGSHPAVNELDARVGAGGFDATSWAGEIKSLLGLA